ncbi:hypothetical protein RHSIM_Rhsim02G0246700 [Rhododendron simsii]|uniref:Peptidase A1 domain-containing protein n=1 Tax=Rhododendron simsii TaxID=118357 RepID=A0A834LVM6_RHOSS|nr:hypothetical protein RHSIM_Rhsim02G0246700 [Rhododendron simsii]
MASSSLQYLFLSSLSIFFFHLSHSSAAQIALQPKGSTAVHLPVRTNTTSHSHQYYTTLELGDRDPSTLNVIRNEVSVVIDLGGQRTWIDCDKYNSTSYHPIPCGSRKCEAAKGSGCMGCTLPGPPRPGCTNDTCGSDAYNPIKNMLYAAGLGEDVMEVYSTDGQSAISSNTVPDFPFSCGASAQLRGLAFGTIGMGIYSSAVDLSKSLATTPLLINPVSTAPSYSEGDPSDEYFIDVKFIRVSGIRLGSFNASLLAIDKQGNSGTKLSTVAPHTVLQSSIYESVVNKFVKTAALKKIKRVASVSPFGACFDSKTIGTSSTGPDVPVIDLVFQKGVYWRIYGANLMVRVKTGALCLGLVDGGAAPRTSVVLGGHQLENYLEFDLGSSTLGFSSSLLLHNTSCSHNRIFQ